MRHLLSLLVAGPILMWLAATPAVSAQTQPRPIRGAVTWSQSRTVSESVVVAKNSILTIAPGVEVRLAQSVAIYVEAGGTLISAGTEDQPVRLSNVSDEERWEGIFGLAESSIILNGTDVTGGGAGGTLLAISSGKELKISSVRFLSNGGQIRVENTPLILEYTEVTASEMPYGAAVDVLYDPQMSPQSPRSVKLNFSRITANRLSPGAPIVRIANNDPGSTVDLELNGNHLEGFQGAELMLMTEGPINGTAYCNWLTGGTQGIRLQSTFAPPNLANSLHFRLNVIEHHQIQFDNLAYVQRNIGLGATSDLPFDATGNWWGHHDGPFAPNSNPNGRGDGVGVNIQFLPWLSERPPCAR